MKNFKRFDPVSYSIDGGDDYVVTIKKAWTFNRKVLRVLCSLLSVGKWLALVFLPLFWDLGFIILFSCVVYVIRPKVPVYAVVRHIPSGAIGKSEELPTKGAAIDSAMEKLQATSEFVTWQRDRKEFDDYLDGIEEWLNRERV